MELIAGLLLGVVLTVCYVGVFSLGAVPGAFLIPLAIRWCRRYRAQRGGTMLWLLLCLVATPVCVLLIVGLVDLSGSLTGFAPLFPIFFQLQLGWLLLAIWLAWFWTARKPRAGRQSTAPPTHTAGKDSGDGGDRIAVDRERDGDSPRDRTDSTRENDHFLA